MSRDTKINCSALGDQCPLHEEIKTLREELALLKEQVSVDSLTGLYNHRYLINLLHKEMERTHRSGAGTGVIMIDLDHFKQVNDNYGHEVGNVVLRSVADTIKASIRKLDVACRYGGEEFSVVVPTCDLSICVKIAQRIRQSIELMEIRSDDYDIKITASLGVACYSIYRNETPEQLLQRADQHLYAAKHAGRNCVKHDEIAKVKTVSVSSDEKEAISGLFN